jgi:hypothetical protein
MPNTNKPFPIPIAHAEESKTGATEKLESRQEIGAYAGGCAYNLHAGCAEEGRGDPMQRLSETKGQGKKGVDVR